MSKDEPRLSGELVVQRITPVKEPETPLGFWQSINAENRARIERSLAVAEQARLIRHQATDERLFLEATWRRRWERRAQLEEQDYQLQALRNLQESEQLELDRERVGQARHRHDLQAQIEQRKLSGELEVLVIDDDDEGLTVEEAAQQLTVLKSYIEGLKADKQALVESDSQSDGAWQIVQELSETIAQFEKMHRELHGQYTKHVLGIR